MLKEIHIPRGAQMHPGREPLSPQKDGNLDSFSLTAKCIFGLLHNILN